MSTHPALDMTHTALSEEEALRFLDGHRIKMGDRTMDPKAQIVGEFVKSIRVPGFFPPLPELREQLRVMVTLMDEPAPRSMTAWRRTAGSARRAATSAPTRGESPWPVIRLAAISQPLSRSSPHPPSCRLRRVRC